jgi:DNA primase
VTPASADHPSRTATSLAALRTIAGEHVASCAADPGGWHRLLAAAAVNGRHGFFNAALIDAQQPDAGPAATSDEWGAAGWQVRKGQQAAGWIITQQDDRTSATPVFTRNQVRPARTGARPPLPGTVRISAGSPDRALGALVALARRRGYTVTRPEDSSAGPVTDWDQRTITIPAGTPPAATAAALAHQLAHIIRDGDLGAMLLPGAVPAARDRPHQPGGTPADCWGSDAVEADSAAWLVLTRLGVDPADAGVTFPAARTWAGGDRRSQPTTAIAAAGERIVATADQITAHAGKVLASLPEPPSVQVPAPAHTAEPSPEPPLAQPALAQPAREATARRASVAGRAAWPFPDQDLVGVNAAAAAYFRANLPRSWVTAYLRGRGFGPDITRRWQLGYAPGGWTRLLDHLRARGYPDALIEAAGLARQSSRGTLIDVFRNRAMFPVRGVHGQIVAFAGRAPAGAAEGTPKYLNSPGTSIFHKDHVLYGLAEGAAALHAGARPVLVEGYLDVIAVTEAGRFMARSGAGVRASVAGVAPGGTSLSSHQMELLAATCDLRIDRPLLVALDPDAAGLRAAVRDFRLICPYSPAAAVPVLPEGADPADIFKDGGPQALAAALGAGEHPLADVAIDAVIEPWKDKLQWVEGQIGAVRAAARLLAEAKPDDPAAHIARVAELTGIPFDQVADDVLDALKAAEPRPKGKADDDQRSRDRGGSLEYPAGPAAGRQRGRPPAPPGRRRDARRPHRH